MSGGSSDEYWRRHGLSCDPFPGERADWYSDDDLRRRLDLLVYLLQSGDQMVLLRGESGSGRSALLRQFLASAGERFVVCAVGVEPGFNAARLLVALSHSFADDLAGGDSEDLGERLAAIQRDGGTPLLALDGVERLSGGALDTVLELYERMGESGRLLRVLLVGPPEAERVLGEYPRFRKYQGELRTLDLSPLTERQVEAYLEWCLTQAGGSAKALFTTTQMRTIIERGGGLPGRINEMARWMLGGEPAAGVAGGEAMNLSKLRELDIKKVLAWSGVALLLLAILIFQGRINEMIQGEGAAPMGRDEPEGQPVAILRRAGDMPQGKLPDQVVREPVFRPPPLPAPVAPPTEVAKPLGAVEHLEPTPLGEIPTGSPVEGPAAMVGESGTPGTSEAAPAPEGEVGGAMAGDPLAGAPLEHRIPHLEKPTPFQPSEPASETPLPPEKPTMEMPEAPAPEASAPPLAPAPPPMEARTMNAKGEAPKAAPPEPAPEPKPEAAEVEAKAPAVREASPEPSPSPPSGTEVPVERAVLKGEEWLLEQPSGYFALQVLGGADRQALEAFADQHGLVERGAIFHGDNHGRSWYGLISGVYPELDEARAALRALPRLSSAYTPWTRSIASVQKEILKARGKSEGR